MRKPLQESLTPYVKKLREQYMAQEGKRGEQWDQYDVVTKLREMGFSWAKIGKIVGKSHSAVREKWKRYERWEKLGHRGKPARERVGLKSYE